MNNPKHLYFQSSEFDDEAQGASFGTLKLVAVALAPRQRGG
jgi:hypothetical protein